MEELLAQWYYHVPNYVLAALMWTLAGRFLLGLFVPPQWDNYIWRFFCRITDPVLAVVARITPSFMVEQLLPLVAIFWLFVLRIVLQLLVFPEARLFWLLVLHVMGLVPQSWLPTG
jgi:YggT family protein